MRRKLTIVVIVVIFCLQSFINYAQVKEATGELLAPTPPMGWMTWNYFAENIHEKDIREMADAMVNSGMRDLGYQYINILLFVTIAIVIKKGRYFFCGSGGQ